jgi:hypothetical protein
MDAIVGVVIFGLIVLVVYCLRCGLRLWQMLWGKPVDGDGEKTSEKDGE